MNRCPHITGYKTEQGQVVFTCSSPEQDTCGCFTRCVAEMSAAIGMRNIEQEIRQVFPQDTMGN